jgi:ribosomal protein S18 acetylase RimI-like enzyme
MPLSSPALALTTRPATESDIPLLRDLAERIWRASYAAMIPPEQVDFMLNWMYAPEQIARELRDGVAWELAFADSRPAGFFSIGFEEPWRAKLHKLYLLPELQGAGLGQALLQRAHEFASAQGASEIWLQVNKRNTRAIRAYERAGYLVERSAVFEIGQGFVMDDFIMQRSLISPSSLEREDHRQRL